MTSITEKIYNDSGTLVPSGTTNNLNCTSQNMFSSVPLFGGYSCNGISTYGGTSNGYSGGYPSSSVGEYLSNQNKCYDNQYAAPVIATDIRTLLEAGEADEALKLLKEAKEMGIINQVKVIYSQTSPDGSTLVEDIKENTDSGLERAFKTIGRSTASIAAGAAAGLAIGKKFGKIGKGLGALIGGAVGAVTGLVWNHEKNKEKATEEQLIQAAY